MNLNRNLKLNRKGCICIFLLPILPVPFPSGRGGKRPGDGGHGLGKKVLKIRPNEMRS
jgi:hypothetical protein